MLDSPVVSSRRQFIFKTAVTFLTANTSVYIVGSAFKNLDGSFVAGAKCPATTGPLTCPVSLPESGSGYSHLFTGAECFTAGGLSVDTSADCNPDDTWHFGN